MHVELVSVDKPIWSGEANAVYARTPEGEIGVLPGHAPLLASLVPGWIVRIERDNEPELRVAVHGGFLSVRNEGVSVLAELAESAEQIDVARAREGYQRLQGENSPEGIAARDRALARLRAAGESV
jgi:F-type H+-transporting ATPase subunit epsilon